MDSDAWSWSNIRSMCPLALTKLPSARPAVPSTPFSSRASNRMLISSFARSCTCHVSVKVEKNMASARKATMLPRWIESLLSCQLSISAVSNWLSPSPLPRFSNMIGSVLRNWSVAPWKNSCRKDTICSVSWRSRASREDRRCMKTSPTSGCARMHRRTNLISVTHDSAFQTVASVAPARCIAANRLLILALICSVVLSGSCSASGSSSSTSKKAARNGCSGPTMESRCSTRDTASRSCGSGASPAPREDTASFRLHCTRCASLQASSPWNAIWTCTRHSHRCRSSTRASVHACRSPT
mmetsp:Transcript_8427/g.23783  ORF Transcript_8427/g.23783 Transcript_8427/m.23783 type:complete len:298 (-) Transcript_8427:228-1121(-)